MAIARAVLWNSKLVILDEPTAALGVAQTEQVLKLVRRLADRGLAVILISHNLNDVFEVADSIAVLYLGQMVAQIDAHSVNNQQVVELITAGRSGDMGIQRAPGAGAGDTGTIEPVIIDKGGAYTARGRGVTHHRRGHARPSRPSLRVMRWASPTPSVPTGARLRGGDVGSLPAVLGLIVLVVFFSVLRPDTFQTSAQLREPHQPGRRGHGPVDGPHLRPAARRDRPVCRLHGRHLRRGHGL